MQNFRKIAVYQIWTDSVCEIGDPDQIFILEIKQNY